MSGGCCIKYKNTQRTEKKKVPDTSAGHGKVLQKK
jgi:hypothetical protein